MSEEQLALYEALGVGLPTLSPDERMRRILAHRNERVLYRRRCSATGDTIVSIHHDRVLFPVYSQDYWWSDNWDQYSQGRPYDFSRSFFEQFAELYAKVPQIALNSPQSENSEWTNQSGFNKNCYMIICGGYSDSCLYGMLNTHCDHCLDCGSVFTCQWCYELFNCYNCFQCRYSDNLEQCSDCLFCRELVGCTDCIGCVGLQHKRFYYFNEPLSPEKYQQIKGDLRLQSRSSVEEFRRKFDQFQRRYPRRYQNGKMIENSSGDYLSRTENVHNTYNFRESKNLWDCRDGWNCHGGSSLVEVWTQDHCIEIEGSLGNTSCGFCKKIWESGRIWYSSHIYYSKEIFGCVGLRHAEYCILNKRYSPDEYHELVARIITQMKTSGEWGNNFPINHSPFAYNLSMAQEYYPLSQAQVASRGYRWEEFENSPSPHQSGWAAPDKIDEVNEVEALSQLIKCEESGRLFRLQKAELAFYKNQGIPVPVLHHDVRFYRRRNQRRNPRRLFARQCNYCGEELLSTYATDMPYTLACEDCYSKNRDQPIEE